MVDAGSGVEVRALTDADAGAFWALRFRALSDHPEAFGTAAEEWRWTTVAEVGERLRRAWAPPDGVVVGAFAGGALVGAVGMQRPDAERRRLLHKGLVWSVYVAPEQRGRGLGRAMLVEVVDRARRMEGLEQLHLMVGAESGEARRLYHSLGFVEFGVERRSVKLDDRYLDEAYMVLFLGEDGGIGAS
jgi:L-amino acid N-acyltransferase YncA